MLPILLSAKDGRRKLYCSKLLALMSLSLVSALISDGLEAGVFALRGWLGDSHAPIYSISTFAECPMYIPLGKAYWLCLGVRTVVTVLFAGMVFGLSIFIRNAANLIFTALCLLLLPLFLGNVGLFFHGGLLCGSRVLLGMGSGVSLSLCLTVAALYSAAALILGARRHQRGL